MRKSLWRTVFGVIPGCVACLMVAPTASAADPCSAAGVAATASGVLNSASGYLDAHPDANNLLTSAVGQPPAEAKSTIRGYFTGHVSEALELRNIAQPLLSLKTQCPNSVSPDQLAALVDALSG